MSRTWKLEESYIYIFHIFRIGVDVNGNVTKNYPNFLPGNFNKIKKSS